MTPSAQPFFLATAAGRRFCLHHPPQRELRGAVLYLQPFAEEMNKSRRMVAEMARRLARQGYAVLQIDLAGCGDSEGDFADASWSAWQDDIGAADAWLQTQYPGQPLILWGLRLGGLLAAAYAAAHPQRCRQLLLWAPVANGEQFLTQFLRLRVANRMLTGEQGGGTQQSMQQLHAGEAVEIAGYMLAPQLALPLADARLSGWLTPAMRVDWFELVASADRPLPPVVEKLAGAWREQGSTINLQRLTGEAFWNTQEITDVPALWDASLNALVEHDAVS